ncbi:hypothetical protein Tco_0374795 [Tanacetum coccineum]
MLYPGVDFDFVLTSLNAQTLSSRSGNFRFSSVFNPFEPLASVFRALSKSGVKSLRTEDDQVGKCKAALGFNESQRGLYWVKWKTVLFDPKFGGLGVGCLQAKNLGLLGKWKWRFLMEDKALWNIVIKEFYGVDEGFNSTPNQFGCGIWTDIIKVVKCIEGIDNSFKVLYALETHKDCKISDRWRLVNNVWGGNWSWRFTPRGRAIDDLSSLTSSIGNLSLSMDGMDRWQWTSNVSSIFKVNIL